MTSNEQTPLALWEDSREEVSNDCACAETEIAKVGNFIHGKDKHDWKVAANLFSMTMHDHHTLFFNPKGEVTPIVVNRLGRQQLETFSQPKPLATAFDQQLAALNLLEPANAPARTVERKVSTLTSWLHVTNACNLRCSYCYVTKTDEAMDEEIGKQALKTIFQTAIQHQYSAVKLKYAGGEAILNFRLLAQLHAYATELAAQTKIKLKAVILSNGVALAREMLVFIREHQVTLMISLDGSEDEHNSQRTFRNGRGSYNQVVRSIDRALAHGIKPHLSITVTGKSVDGLAKAVEFALERDLLFNLNFYRQHDPQQSQADLRAEDERLIAAMRAAFAVIEQRLPKQSLIGSLVDRASFAGLHTRSCGAGHDYIVIDQKGGVARCQMEIERPITDVFSANPLQAIRLYESGFQNLSVDEKEGCRDCQWRYWCGGGCSLLTHRVTGRSDVKSPYCNVYKTIYPELLRLEGLRLLKWRN